ncbi:hypothetical protein LGQ02_16375 [Bacillus shivajii]|uniref:hypothetical protein n=1 Tax=Bacillus shivajii TaxID=1983719 RepID=UPI001CFBB5B5|nr:hypothetical protein [Bacillus shivajii]UCZ52401.1 hypothetical protein LGQ02_16375 [Bacillus shivajii]
MANRQKFFIIAGAIILVALSVLMLYLYQTDPTSYPIERNNEQEQDTTVNENTDNMENINITNENNNENEEHLSDSTNEDELEEKEYKEHAQTVINEHYLPHHEYPTKQSFFDHALLNQEYTMLTDGFHLEEEEANEYDARLTAIELVSWLEVAQQRKGFEYNENTFLSFVENNGLREELEDSARVFLNELEKENELLLVRQLEFRFLKPYIWNEIKSDVMATEEMKEDETEEEYNFRMYYEFEQDVFEYLIENYPEVVDGTP